MEKSVRKVASGNSALDGVKSRRKVMGVLLLMTGMLCILLRSA